MDIILWNYCSSTTSAEGRIRSILYELTTSDFVNWNTVQEKIIIENSYIISSTKIIFGTWRSFQRVKHKSKNSFIFHTARLLRKAVQ